MAAKITYTVELPDGNIATRKSARAYSHVVAVLSGKTPETATWGVWSFNGRLDLAAKEAAKLESTIGQQWVSGHIDYDVRIIPLPSAAVV